MNTAHHNPLQHPLGAWFAYSASALFIVALVTLGQAIGWPGILREPPATVFPRIHANHVAMLAGYACYLLSSLALVPVALALREKLLAGGVSTFVVDAVTFFGLAGAIFKALGIVRWLIGMPGLAAQYMESTSQSEREVLEVAYLTLNGYAGSVGELLGVQLTSGVWMLGISICVLRRFGRRWVSALGILSGLGFIVLTARIFVPKVAALQSFVNPIGLAWVIALGWTMSRRSS